MRISMSVVCELLCVIAAVAGCTVPADHPALEKASLPALIQAHRFAYNGDVSTGYQLSPDGRRLAWVGPYLMRSRLFVRDNDTGEVRKYRIGSKAFQWTPDARRLLYASDKSGTENSHVYMIDVTRANAQEVDLTPFPEIKAGIHQFVSGAPHQVLVVHNRRDRSLPDLYRIDLDTREETLIAQNPGDALSPVTAPEGRILGWRRSRDAQLSEEERRRPLAVRRPDLSENYGESFRVLGKRANGAFVWALSSRGRDRVALVAAHPTLGWEKVIFEDPHVDVTRVDMSRVTGDPLIVHAQPGYPRTEILDLALRNDLQGLLGAQGSEPFGLEIVSADSAEKRLVIMIYTYARQRYYLVDRSDRSYRLLAETDEALARSLVPMHPITIESSDGLQLRGYLTLPRGVAPNKLPTVLFVHGGPWLRTHWDNPLRSDDASYAQFLANRGYAVLQINFRGSTGYGRRLLAAGIGEFAGKMQQDLHDTLRWAVTAGIADPARTAIMGYSYGGYAALVGLTLTPEVFACGISLGGPTDLASLIESFPPYAKVDLSMWRDYVGHPDVAEDREAMTQKSPLSHAEKVQRPLLLVQGGSDVRVRADQAERMVQALRRAGKPVEYLGIPQMGHGMGYWAHRLAVLRRTEAFLHGCIGGRASRFDSFDVLAWAWTRIN